MPQIEEFFDIDCMEIVCLNLCSSPTFILNPLLPSFVFVVWMPGHRRHCKSLGIGENYISPPPTATICELRDREPEMPIAIRELSVMLLSTKLMPYHEQDMYPP
jgi:hypothetical protein